MIMKQYRLIILLAAAAAMFASCKEDIKNEDFDLQIYDAVTITDVEATLRATLDYSVDATIYKVVFVAFPVTNTEERITDGAEQSGNEYTLRMRGLRPDRTYKYYASIYVKELGHNIRTEEVVFRTVESVDITTQEATDITVSTATLNATVSEEFIDEIQEAGFYYRETARIAAKWTKVTCDVGTNMQAVIGELAEGVQYSFYAYALRKNNAAPTVSETLEFQTL